METVKKRPSLRRVLAGYLVLTGGLCLLAAVLWWTGLSFLMRAGVIQPANQMAETAYQAKTAVEAAGTLPPDRLPAGCRYLLLGPEGQTLSTNLTGSRLEAARERRSKAGPFSPYRLRLLEVPQTDGSVYRFQYDYAVHYTDPALDEALPDFQICWLLAEEDLTPAQQEKAQTILRRAGEMQQTAARLRAMTLGARPKARD